jgi:hypothetical protein
VVSVRGLDGGLDEGEGEASVRLRCGGLLGGESTAARDGGRLPASRTVGFGDIALTPSPSVGDFALCPSPSVGDFALWPTTSVVDFTRPSPSTDRGNLVRPLIAEIVLLNPRVPPVVRSDERGIRSAGIPLFEHADTKREMFAFRWACSCETFIWVIGGGWPGILKRILKYLEIS